MASDIAIIGLSGVYAGARDVPTFWQNILNKVDAISEADAEWTGPYLDPESTANDRIYTNRGGFLRDLATFNPTEFGIMPNSIDGGEPDQYLALRLARDALLDAGYLDKDFNREKAGVVLGRGTYVNRGYTTLMQHGLVIDQTLDLLRQLRPDLSLHDLSQLRGQLKDSAPPFTTAMAPGLVPNVVSGLISNRLNLMGPNYIIDAACASTLIATDVAMRDLASGRADLMVTGGIQAHTPPQIYMIFCQLGALSRGKLRPFDAQAGGTLLGEGAGMVVLKRLADAERDHDRIYGVIKGYGASSDGRAKGLLAPRMEGEVLAIQRAYADAGVDPASVGLVEAHGTGIALGDKTEIEALTQVFGARKGRAPSVAIGSVKSMISHCIPAAGSASIIKTVLALHHKVLPPTLCDEVNPALELEKTRFYVNTETRPWVQGGAALRRAGINAFGFGGVNAHLVLEEYRPADSVRLGVMKGMTGVTGAAVSQPIPVPSAPAAMVGSSELFCYAAASHAGLLVLLREAVTALRDDQALAALAVQQLAALPTCSVPLTQAHRLALVVTSVADLSKKLSHAIGRLEESEHSFKTRSGTHYGHGEQAGKLAVLFPGEGAQYPGMLAELAVCFAPVREWFDFLDSTIDPQRGYRPADVLFAAPNSVTANDRRTLEHHLYDMDFAAESVFAASQALWSMYRKLGLQADMLVGHSTGENTALVAAGAIKAQDEQALAAVSTGLNRIYKKLEAQNEIKTGSLLTIGALDAHTRDEILRSYGDALVVAMDNCPNQAVVFGEPEVVQDAHTQLTNAGAICGELPFGRAYHTAAFAPVVQAFRSYYQELPIAAPHTPVFSCASLSTFPAEPDAIRDLACSQWARPVRFRETVEALYDQGYRVFLEVGPSANLSSFVGDVLKGSDDVVALASNSRRQPALKTFQSTLAALFATGVPVDVAALYADRRDAHTVTDRRKAGPPLKLAMPLLSFSQVPPLPIADEPVPASIVAPAAPSASPLAVAQSVPVASASATTGHGDNRAQALQVHFSLMQDFLESQGRVMGLSGHGAAAPVAPARASPPLLTQIIAQSPDALSAKLHLDPRRDLYLLDHCIGGVPTQHQEGTALPVVPFTFSMEILAEAAGVLAPEGWVCRALNQVRGHRWLALDYDTLDLRVEVQSLGQQPDLHRYQCRIYLDRDGALGHIVFEAEVEYARSYAAAPVAQAWHSSARQPALRNPADTLYSRGMFHGARLQGVRALSAWGECSIEAELTVLPVHDYLADEPAPVFRIDPALLDAAGQLAGYWLSEKYADGFNCFPFQLARYEQYAAPAPTGTAVRCHGEFDEHAETPSFAVQWDLKDAQGTVLSRATGWTDRKFDIPKRYAAYRLAPQHAWLSSAVDSADLPAGLILRRLPCFAADFMTQGWGVWMRVLVRLALTAVEQQMFYALPTQGSRREQWLMGRIVAKEAARAWIAREYRVDVANADIHIVSDAHGKPSVQCAVLGARPAPSISLSHSAEMAVAVAGDPQLSLGLDVQAVSGIRTDDVAHAALSPSEHQYLVGLSADEKSRRTLALWSAKEAVAKATGLGLQGRPQDFQITQAVFEAQSGKPAMAHVRYQNTDYAAQWLSTSDQTLLALASTQQISYTQANTVTPAGCSA